MHSSSYRLGSVKGIICIVETSSAFNEPILIDHYWPTTTSARDFLHFYQGMYCTDTTLTELLASAVVSKSYGHEYSIQLPNHAKQFVNIQGGGSARAVLVEERPYPAPKTKVKTEYLDGHWFKCLKSGRVRC